MIRALFARNLRQHLRILLAMMAGLAAFEVLLIVAGAQIESAAGLRNLVEMLPPAFREMLASQLNLLSFASMVALGFQHPFTLAIAVGFAVMAATIPAAERESGLLDLLLARPLSRARYLLATLAMLASFALLLPSCLYGGVVLGLRLVEVPSEIPASRYLPCAVGLAFLMLAVGGFALLVASGAARRGPAAAQVVGVTLAALVVEFLADFWSALKWVRWASPFHYYKPIPAAVLQQAPPRDLIVLGAIFAVSTLLAFVRFSRRDI